MPLPTANLSPLRLASAPGLGRLGAGMGQLYGTDWRGIYTPKYVGEWPPGHTAYDEPSRATKNFGNLKRDYPAVWSSLLVNWPWVKEYENAEPLPQAELDRIMRAQTPEDLAKPPPTPVVVVPQAAIQPTQPAPVAPAEDSSMLLILGLAAAALLLS